MVSNVALRAPAEAASDEVVCLVVARALWVVINEAVVKRYAIWGIVDVLSPNDQKKLSYH